MVCCLNLGLGTSIHFRSSTIVFVVLCCRTEAGPPAADGPNAAELVHRRGAHGSDSYKCRSCFIVPSFIRDIHITNEPQENMMVIAKEGAIQALAALAAREDRLTRCVPMRIHTHASSHDP